MTKLDSLIQRVRLLPQEQQDAIAIELEELLNEDDHGPLLSDEQWADLRRRAAEDQGPLITHEDIEAELLPTRGR